MRLVLDTCVLVAAMRSRLGASYSLLNAALSARFDLVLSAPLVLEYEAVLTRREQLLQSGLTTDEVSEFLEILCDAGILLVRDPRWRPQLRDTNDEMVLEAAINGRVDAIVTFNRRDFAPAYEKFKIQVISPQEALVRIKLP
jgi:putative PIN family toxin of toxin-antitoxin system